MYLFHESLKMEHITKWGVFAILLFSTSAFSFKFRSFHELRTTLLNDSSHEYISLPYQEEDKYTESGAAIGVKVRLVIADGVENIKDDRLDVTVHLQAVWTDSRLSFNATSSTYNYTLPEPVHNKIWTPTPYLEPEWQGSSTDTRVLRIFPTGLLVESRRIQTTIPCDVLKHGIMYFQLQCASIVTTYAYGTDEVHLSWIDNEPVVLIGKTFHRGKGHIDAALHDSCKWNTFQELPAPCIEVTLLVTVSVSGIFYRMYIPSFMAVMMAWSSFWINRDEVSARIKLGTLVVWTMITEYTSIGFAYPEYLRSLAGNVWMIGCLFFTWLSFFMYTVVHVVRRKEKARNKQALEREQSQQEQEKKNGQRAYSISDIHPDGVADQETVKYSIVEKKTLNKSRPRLTSFQVDRMCRLWFGIAFTAFNIVFWVYFSLTSHDRNVY